MTGADPDVGELPRGTFVTVDRDRQWTSYGGETRPSGWYMRVLTSYLDADGRLWAVCDRGNGTQAMVSYARITPVLPLPGGTP